MRRTAYNLAEMEPKKLGDTVADMEGIAYTIRQFEAHTLGDVKVEPLFDTLA